MSYEMKIYKDKNGDKIRLILNEYRGRNLFDFTVKGGIHSLMLIKDVIDSKILEFSSITGKRETQDFTKMVEERKIKKSLKRKEALKKIREMKKNKRVLGSNIL